MLARNRWSTLLYGLAGATVLAVGCATPLQLALDDHADLSPYRTWRWANESVARVDAPEGDEAALDELAKSSIERELAAKGYERVDGEADFVVSYRLGFRRREVVEYRPRASYLLSSHSNSPSFEVSGSTAVTRVHHAMQLTIGAGRIGAERHWRAELSQQSDEVFALSLEEAVARLLERFPSHAPCDSRCSPPQRDDPEDAEPHAIEIAERG